MDFFEWNPTLDEKAEIVCRNFENIISQKDMQHIKRLVYDYREQPISFFSELKNDIFKEKATDYITQSHSQNLRSLLDLLNQSISYFASISINEINRFAQYRIASHEKAVHEERTGLHHG